MKNPSERKKKPTLKSQPYEKKKTKEKILHNNMG